VFNPFPGLRPFEPNEDHLFFGREKEIDDLMRRLRAGRFLAIIGTSGCGKSSLVRSGLIPALGGGAMSDASSDWKIAIMRPGDDPIRHLAQALNAPGALGARGDVSAATNSVLLEATLRRGTRGLVEAVRQARIEKGANVLLVVDQFEELFRCRKNVQLEKAHDESIAFVKSLLEASDQRDFPIYVVLTMRSDFIGDCMEFTGLPEAVNDGLYLVPRMSRDEVRLAITGPVAVGGGKISQRLVLRLLNDFGDDINQLPVLQHALMRTWDHWQARDPKTEAMDIDDYEAIGTMKESLSIHAEEAYEEAGTPVRKRIVEKVFKGLTDKFSDPRGIRRPTSVSELTAISEAPVAEVQSVIELFRRPGRSFLTPGPDVPLEDRCIVDVSHESLMRSWQRLVTWAEEERRSADSYSRLSAAARWHEEGSAGLWRNPELEIALRWKEKNRPTQAWAQRYNQVFPLAMSFLEQSEAERTREDDEKRHERRRKLRQMQWTVGVLASLLLVTLVFAAIAIRQTRVARENLQTAMSAVDASLSTAGQQQTREAGDLPEVQAFRKDLLDKAATFYRQLASQNKGNPEFLVEEARAHVRLGDIDRLMGSDTDAVQEYSGSIDRLSELVKRDPKKAEYRASLAYVHNWLGYTISGALDKAATFGQYTRNDAENEYSQAIALQDALHTEEPGNMNYQQQHARTHYNRGINRYYAHNADGAKADFLEAIALLEPLARVATAAAKGTNREPAQDLARVYNNYAVVMAKEKDIKDAERYYDQSIALAEQLVAKQPQNRYYKSELSQYAFNEARLEADNGQLEEADGHGKRALDLLDQLSKPTPALTLALVKALQLEGQIWCVSDPKRGIALTDRAFSTLRELDREGTQKAGSLDPLYTNIGINYLELGRAALANQDRKTAMEALDRLQDAMPHLTDEERNSFTGPYEALHTALYKERGKASE
jgi:tetratricopeptide (TPR) repeat protein/energy-coupling factor transporter ATP-binding protein EcfA2